MADYYNTKAYLPLNGLHIFIINDDRRANFTLKLSLPRFGAKVFYPEKFNNGIEAITQMPQCNMVLIDIQSVTMSQGIKITNQIINLGKEPPIDVIAILDQSDQQSSGILSQAGSKGTLFKQWSTDQIERYLAPFALHGSSVIPTTSIY